MTGRDHYWTFKMVCNDCGEVWTAPDQSVRQLTLAAYQDYAEVLVVIPRSCYKCGNARSKVRLVNEEWTALERALESEPRRQ